MYKPVSPSGSRLFSFDTNMNIRPALRLFTAFFCSCSLLSAQGPEHFTAEQLHSDFALLVTSLKEAHTGLYRYTSPARFDSVVQAQKARLHEGMNALEFYRVVAPVVAWTREDHCDIHLSAGAAAYLRTEGRFLPLPVLVRGDSLFILADAPEQSGLRGKQLLALNGQPLAEIFARLFNTFAADGYIQSSKERYLDHFGFAREYARVLGWTDTFELQLRDPLSGTTYTEHIASVSLEQLREISNDLHIPGQEEDPLPAHLHFEADETARLVINTFSNSQYREAKMNFRQFVKRSFRDIRKAGSRNLIIDIRNNGGGSEGNEDYLFSFLTDKPYTKYRFVELSAFSFSFFPYTDYRETRDRKQLEHWLRQEHHRTADGRLLRKPGVEKPAPLQKKPFRGNMYILAGGWTYSGAAEFSSLMRAHTAAVFIGEETGGTYCGNTSGYSLELSLPNTGVRIDIPILRFEMNVNGGACDRGVLPDHPAMPSVQQYLQGYDAALEKARELIRSRTQK